MEKILSCSTPSTLAAVSLENEKSLDEASRILIVFAIDAQNSNMRFIDENQEKLKDYGTLPVLVQTGKFSLEIHRQKKTGRFHLYSLDLAGKRIAEIPVIQHEDRICFSIDTAKTPDTPSVFFELTEIPVD